jgi:hypothetical protein
MEFIDMKKEIKIALLNVGITSKQLVTQLNEKYNRSPHAPSLSKKLKNNTIRFREVEEIFDVLGYDITITKRK